MYNCKYITELYTHYRPTKDVCASKHSCQISSLWIGITYDEENLITNLDSYYTLNTHNPVNCDPLCDYVYISGFTLCAASCRVDITPEERSIFCMSWTRDRSIRRTYATLSSRSVQNHQPLTFDVRVKKLQLILHQAFEPGMLWGTASSGDSSSGFRRSVPVGDLFHRMCVNQGGTYSDGSYPTTVSDGGSFGWLPHTVVDMT